MHSNRREFFQFLAASTVLTPSMRALAQQLAVSHDQPGVIMSAKEALQVMDFEEAARRALPPAHWGYMASGVDDDLTLRAARALREAVRVPRGVAIRVDKRIPMGAGLGGGSSDAASVLLGLNRLWALRLSRDELIRIGMRLGADVPFFLGEGAALARGIGEVLTPMSVPPCFVTLAMPRAHVSTASIFASRELTRSARSAKISVFSEGYGHNDLEIAAATQHWQVREAVQALRSASPQARMTGSGACVFAPFASERDARLALSRLPAHTPGRVVRTVDRHPLAAFA